MVLRIGHRGAAGHEPENTLRSFATAASLGADMVELDVHICASGELVVIHDETVDRTTDGFGAVSEMTLRELRSLNAGKGEKIPTLGEVFSAVPGRIGVNIELKGLGTSEPVHAFLTHLFDVGSRFIDDVLVTSFDWGMLGRMRELSGEMHLGSLAYEDMDEALQAASELEAYSVNPYYGRIDTFYVSKAHAAGLMVYPWTVNERVDIRKVVGFGVDGVISDYPDRV